MRAVLALWVVINHHAYGALPDPSFENHLLSEATWLFDICFNGQAAVILFFILSGFCIHWPYSSGRSLPEAEFLTQRFLRIGVPLAAALGLGWLAGLRGQSVWTAPISFGVPIWSLWCEIIYYIFYPFLYRLISRFGIKWAFAASLLPCLIVLFTMRQWSEPRFFNDGGICFWRSAIMGLPFWLSGVWLAVRGRATFSSGNSSRITSSKIGLYRVAVYFAQGVSCLLAYRFSIGCSLTLLLLMPLFVMWMQMEIRYFSSRQEPRLLAGLGAMSYSIYLIHLSIFALLLPLNEKLWPLPFRWLISIGSILACSWVFYRCVELPSHRLARAAGAWVRRRAESGRFWGVPVLI
jgi:peptidoglycan/LPS O-acetylase OafA/YrhL